MTLHHHGRGEHSTRAHHDECEDDTAQKNALALKDIHINTATIPLSLVSANENGSRSFPLLFYFRDFLVAEFFEFVLQERELAVFHVFDVDKNIARGIDRLDKFVKF